MGFRKFRILGLDPGTNNFAYSVMEATKLRGESLTLKPLARGLILSTLKDVPGRGPRDQLPYFLQQVIGLHSKFKFDLWIAERYMLRRGAGGSTIESVNMMLGGLGVVLGELPYRLIPASEWKTAVNRNAGHSLEELYASLGAESSLKVTRPDAITVHEVDAAHIAEYGAHVAVGLKRCEFPNAPSVGSLKTPAHLGEPHSKKKSK